MTLREAMNTYNPALQIIQNRGYKIKLCGETDWVATKEDLTISAFNPLSLLALVVMAEEHGDKWRIICKEDLYDKFTEEYVNNGTK